jgi:preprotein translocase subunit SecA
MLSKFVKLVGGDPHKREVDRLSGIIEEINAFEPEFEKLSDEALRAKTDEFRARLLDGETLDDLLPEAFAVVREASKRTLGLRHYDVQMIGGIALHSSKIAEMRTGEGKTLVSTLPIYLNALETKGVHLITVNDYLARRDARWMGLIYDFLGMKVGVLQMAAVTENGKKAFLVDYSKESPREDQHQLRQVDRREAYAADITYGTNAEFGFDYLRDNMVYRLADKVQRGHHFAVVDEVDNVLIDEARTPLIISGPAQGDLEWYGKMSQVVRQLNPEDYEIDEKDRNAILTDVGVAHVETLLGQPLRDLERPEDITPEQARLLGYLEQAMRAQFLFKRNKDYIVQGGKVVIVDDFTGRLMPGRRWSDGLHQAVEAKEGVKIEPENITYATITLQNYFRMYTKLAGMTGTALTEAEEFNKIYKLDVLPIPTNLEYASARADAQLVEIKDKDADGYQIAYFADPQDTQKRPLFWRRTDYPDLVYRTVEAKMRALITDILRSNVIGRPVLLGTTSVDNSEKLSGRLRAESIRRLLQVKLMRQAWFKTNNKEEDGRLYAELEPLYAPLDSLKPGDLREFAKPLGLVSINPEDPENLKTLLAILYLDDEHAERLKDVIKAGVPHEVLNARKHTEESQIIAGAGAFGAVTIATNMAGRGVDIKLGGDLAEEVTIAVSRVLRRAGDEDPYDMRPEEQRQALLKLSPADYGIYDAEVKLFLKYFDDMEQVRALGGLHVIGSERHEARRIDNQLRGRAARQGDPGSSRFYLSLEDDLMRLFGGQQVNDVMQRFKLDDDLPLENRIVSNIIEGSQHRVEGSNFDVRKHLLEYDDVLNAQRARIYGQRDLVFGKQNLSEDVLDFLEIEIKDRIPVAMQDEEGPWKLLAWLEQIQPTILAADGELFPSYTFRLLLDEIDPQNLRESIFSLVQRAIQTENEHHLHALQANVESFETTLEAQIEEREELVDTFLSGLADYEETPRPQEIQTELSSLVGLPIRLNNQQLRDLAEDPASLEDSIKEQVVSELSTVFITRLVASLALRMGEPIRLKQDLTRLEWAEAVAQVQELAAELFSERYERLVGEKGQLLRELDSLLARPDAQKRDESAAIRILNTLPLARRAAGFDAKTHRAQSLEYTRFHYSHLAAQLLAERAEEWVRADVLEHLQDALESLQEIWGNVEFTRIAQNATNLSDFGPAADVLAVDSQNDGMPGLAMLSDLSEEQLSTLKAELGSRHLTGIFRSVLLKAITEQWVDYLTRVEALRVSIGLEAYAQRDPLVQYKMKASDMFQTLLRDIRSAVVSNMFLYRPRTAVVQASEVPVEVVVKQQKPQVETKSKRKRHKRR